MPLLRNLLEMQLPREIGAFYEVIRTHSGGVGLIYDPADGKNERVAVLHALTNGGQDTPADVALSILAHHFGVHASRATHAAYGTPRSTQEEMLAKLLRLFHDELVSPIKLAKECSYILRAENIREWAIVKLRNGTVVW